MDIKDKGKRIKPFAPILSVGLVMACVAGSLSGYKEPVYASTLSSSDSEEKEEKSTAQGSFDLADGVYKGTGTGYAGEITVAVQIKDKKIVSIDILSASDDDAFLSRAKAVIDRIIESQTLDVDTVSGATYSSNGIISAVKNALTGEKDSGETGQSQSGGTATAGSSTSIGLVEDPAAYKDGTYYGTGTGFGGTLKVQVDISGGKIVSIKILENNDGGTYISKASSLINAIISSQSTNVDTVSGATYSSVGIIQAVRDALSQAVVSSTASSNQSGNSNSGKNDSTTDAITGTVPYKEGIYYGTAEGYSGDISVAVVIQDHTIKAILVTDASDDEAFFDRAMDVVKNVVKKQNTDVDTVSGATYSSNGLLNAIRNALEQAEKATNGEQVEAVDTSKLAEAIETVNGLAEADYTEATWAVLQMRLQEAKEAMEAKKQEDVEKALDNLNQAVSLLKKKDAADNENSVYIDGIYTVTVPCEPDEDEDFQAYSLTMNVTIRNDKIVAITNVYGDGASSNDTYIRKATNGTSTREGVVSKIVKKGLPEEIDTVTGATCSSNAIIEGCKKALEEAKR